MREPGLGPEQFKNMMAAAAATVTVVTAYADDTPVGLTVSAFTSVSVDPPIVLYCIDKVAGTLDAMLAAEGFTVNFLPEVESDIALIFATPGIDRFGSLDWESPTVPSAGPTLDAAFGVFECTVVDRIDVGDHWIILGRVGAGGRRDTTSKALLYAERGFARWERIES